MVQYSSTGRKSLDFGDVSSCEVWMLQRGPGESAAIWGEVDCRALEDGSGKEGQAETNGAELAGSIQLTAGAPEEILKAVRPNTR